MAARIGNRASSAWVTEHHRFLLADLGQHYFGLTDLAGPLVPAALAPAARRAEGKVPLAGDLVAKAMNREICTSCGQADERECHQCWRWHCPGR